MDSQGNQNSLHLFFEDILAGKQSAGHLGVYSKYRQNSLTITGYSSVLASRLLSTTVLLLSTLCIWLSLFPTPALADEPLNAYPSWIASETNGTESVTRGDVGWDQMNVATEPKLANSMIGAESLPPSSTGSIAVLQSEQVILHDQTNNPSTLGIVSQQPAPLVSPFDSQFADDFVVPAADSVWTVERIEVLGIYRPYPGLTYRGPTPLVNVYVYADMANLPWAVVYQAEGIVPTQDISGDLTIDLPAPATLTTGTYWLSVQADMDYDPLGTWHWQLRTTQSKNVAVWRNPGDAYGSGCTNWTYIDVCVGDPGLDVDGLFRLSGYKSTTPPEVVEPTFSQSVGFGNIDSTMSTAMGDLNGDGALDIVIGNGGDTIGVQNTIYLNDGDGNFPTATPFGDGDKTTSVAVGDLNGDGVLDIVVGNDFNQQNKIYLNDGMGNFIAGFPFGNADKTSSLALGDLNDDGALDIVVGNSDEKNVIYLNRNDGTGTFFSGTRFGGPDDDTWGLALGDLDGNGALDIVEGNNSIQPNRIYFNDGAGFFSSTIPLSSVTDATQSVAIADLNNDGALDIVIGNGTSSTNEQNLLYLGDGAGHFSSGITLGDVDQTESVAIGDVNGDGTLDIIVGNWNQKTIIYLNDGLGNFTATAAVDTGGVTTSITLGDTNGDGALDIIAGNWRRQSLVLRNDGAQIFSSGDSIGDIADTTDVAVGDMNGDGVLDILVTNGFQQSSGAQNVLYLNDGVGRFSPSFLFSSSDRSTSLAIGDLNSDGALDMVVGNAYSQTNEIYLNDGAGNFFTNITFGNLDPTSDIALGDVNGDDALDIIEGISGQQNMIYLNRNDGTGTFSSGIAFGGTDSTEAVALGDLNGDGTLDIVVGNTKFDTQCGCFVGDQNLLYLNDGQGDYSAGKAFGAVDNTWDIAIGDLNNDGALDLIAGNYFESNLIYFNDSKGNFGPGIPFGIAGLTPSVALGDLNQDGHLDIIASNYLQKNSFYLNDGSGDFSAGTQFGNAKYTTSVAMGDLNNDGAIDLVVGNTGVDLPIGTFFGGRNEIYFNRIRSAKSLLNHVSQLTVVRPIVTGDADFYSTPVILARPIIPITYTLFDPEGDPVRFIRTFYSPNGGGQWLPATPASGTDTTNLSTSSWPTGTTHTFIWQADADLIKSDNVAFRIEAYQGLTGPGPYQWPYASATTFPFRVKAAEWYVKVVSGTQPISGALVYQTSKLITSTANNAYRTDWAGLIRLNTPIAGDPLVALKQMQEQPTNRAAHNGWAYRTYVTSLDLDDQGTPQPDTIGQPGEQVITVRPDDPLILFNIVASIEWDADLAYLQTISRAFQLASSYLYDVTDGQMAFGQAAIYDNAAHWADADFQFSTKNTVRPYAFVGGITSADEAHTIRVGRFWSGDSGSQGRWDQPNGYRTLIHEFGHYALYLHDEYKHLRFENGRFVGEENGACTSPVVRINSSDQTNGSLMYYQYNASELVDSSRWNSNCQQTEQHRRNGEADWQTVRRYYGGFGWQLRTADERPGGVMAGPDRFPDDLLPFPDISINNGGTPGGAARQLTVVNPQGRPVHNALVALYTTPQSYTIAIDQGLTGSTGEITIYGALAGDTIRAATFDGALAGALAVDDQSSYTLALGTVGGAALAARSVNEVPYLSMTPQSNGVSLYLKIDGLNQGSLPLNAFVAPGEGGGSPQFTTLSYAAVEDAYVGTASLNGVGLGTGRVQVIGSGLPPGGFNSDYNLQFVPVATQTALYSEDGNFTLHLPPDSLPQSADAYATVLPTGYVPAPLPSGKQVIGSAYEVRLSGAVDKLARAGVVELRYHPEVMGVYTATAIHYWDPNLLGANQGGWQLRGGESSQVDNALAITTTRLGIYALMGVPEAPGTGQIYLPLIVK